MNTFEIPTVEARLHKGKAVFRCAFCKMEHHHSPEEGHRSAHCGSESESPYRETGYYLRIVGPNRMDPNRPHYLYRFFGEGGTLLYVGVTYDWKKRFAQHQERQPWWSEVVEHEVVTFPDRVSALKAEAKEIAEERPRYNVQGRSGDVARKLLALPDPAVVTELSGGPIVGLYFYGDFDHQWQGRVLAKAEPGVYLIETFSWLTGGPSVRKLVGVLDMMNWEFFGCVDSWNAHADNVQARWSTNERSKTTELL